MPPPTEAAEQKEECSIANLSGGFKLAWDLFDELNHYKSGHPSRCDKAEMDVRFDSLGKKFYVRRKNVSGKKALVEGGKRICHVLIKQMQALVQNKTAAQRRPQTATQRSGCGLEARSSRMSAR